MQPPALVCTSTSLQVRGQWQGGPSKRLEGQGALQTLELMAGRAHLMACCSGKKEAWLLGAGAPQVASTRMHSGWSMLVVSLAA